MYIQNRKNTHQTHSYTSNKNTNVILGALLILLLSIYSDSVRSLLPKKTIDFFYNKKIYTKYIVLFASIYFLIDFAYKNKQSPLFELGLSFIIMVLFIMYSKIHYILNIVIFILLGIIYFMNDIIIYYNENQNDSNRTIYSKYALLYTVKDSLIMLCVLLLIIGYSMYLSS
jgi:hypothetical protein